MGASEIRAGKAYVEMATKDKGFAAGLRKGLAELHAFGAAVAGVGSKIFNFGMLLDGALKKTGTMFANAGSELYVASQRMGMPVETLVQLRAAAARTGVEVEDLEKGFRFMNRSIDHFARGAPDAVRTFRRLGLTIGDLDNKNMAEQFEVIAQALADIPNPGTRAAMALEVFGRGGAGLLPLLNQGAEGIRRLRAQANSPWTTAMARDAHELQLALSALWRGLKSIVIVIGSAFAPGMRDTANLISHVLVGVRDWISRNKALFQLLGMLAIGLITVGAALVGVGRGMSLVAAAGRGLLTLIPMIFGALLSPATLIIGAIAMIGTYLLTMTETGREVLGKLGEAFGEIADVAGETWTGISEAIEDGDWAGAIEIAVAGMRLAWRQLTRSLGEIWTRFVNWFSMQATHMIRLAESMAQGFYDAIAAVLQLRGLTDRPNREAIDEEAYETERRRNQIINQQLRQHFAAGGTEENLPDYLRRSRDRAIGENQAALAAAQASQAEAPSADEEIAELRANLARAIADRRSRLGPLRDVDEEGGAPPLPPNEARKAVTGTFSAFALGQMGADTLAERTAHATERTAVNTEEMGRLLGSMSQGIAVI